MFRLKHDKYFTPRKGILESPHDIIETVNHFHCIDLIIEGAHTKLSESFIKQLHYILKSGTTDRQKTWLKIGDYKTLENEVGGDATTKPADVAAAI